MTTIIEPILIDIAMPIRTPRLMIRNVLPGDGAAMHKIKAESWEELCKWMPFTKLGIGTIDDDEKSFVKIMRNIYCVKI